MSTHHRDLSHSSNQKSSTMNSNDSAGNESSSSNPMPPPNEESPRRGRAGELTPPRLSPHGRGSPPMHPWEVALFTPPRPRAPPLIGAPGRTAFGPYRPPPPQWPFPGGPSHAPGESSRGLGFQPLPVGGGGGGGSGSAASAGGIRIGGSPTGRKRGREAGGGAAVAGNAAGEGGGNAAIQHCSVCNKGFGSAKALFGHMRSHPDRGWKGVHPPPAFRAEEEFADLRVAAAEAEAEAEADEEVEAAEAVAEDEDGMDYIVPDLNRPPPPDAN